MTTIPVAASVQTSAVHTQAAASSSTAEAAQGSEGKTSFAHWLKKSSAHSEEEEQSAHTPRSNAPLKKTGADSKESRSQKSNETPASLLIGAVAQAPVLDPRSLMLATPTRSEEKKGQSTGKPVAQKSQDALPETAPAPAPIVFGVTIPKASQTHVASVETKAAEMPGEQNSKATIVPVKMNAPVVHPNEVTPTANNRAAGEASKQTHSSSNAVPASAGEKPQSNSSSSEQHKNSQGHAKNDNADSSSAAASRPAAAFAQEKDAAPAPVNATANVTPVLSTGAMGGTAADIAAHTAKPVAAAPAAAPVQTVAEPAAPTVRPQSIDLRIGGADSDGVDVRVSQRAGDVQVTVRTPDTGLAQSLRDHLPELSDRLSQSGVHGDVWQATPAQTSADTNSQSDTDGRDAWQGQQDQHQQRQQQEQAGSQQQNQNQPSWLNELNNAEQEGR